MIHRYAQWTRRRASTAQCSPALGVLGLIVAFAVVVYIYRQVILTTIEDAVLAAFGVSVFVAITAVTISTARWYRRQSRARAATATILESRMELPDTWTKTTDDAGVAAISDEAEWLAGGVELAFSPDGKTLVSRDKTK